MTQAFQNAATRTIQVKDTRMVYRDLGERGGVPVIFLHHLTAVLDDWDPKVLGGIAGSHHVVIFDNRGASGNTSALRGRAKFARPAAVLGSQLSALS